MSPSPGFTLFCLGANIFLAILIVLLNKWIYVHIGFPNITMTLIHFILTYVGLMFCKLLNIFTVKRIPIVKLLPLALTFCGFVVLTNLSLESNSVETYQIIKSLTMPCIMFIQKYFYNVKPSLKTMLTLIPLTLGVFLNSCFDLNFNLTGTAYALSAVLVTSLYQIWVGECQKQLQVSSLQLLEVQVPLSALLLVPVVLVLEPPSATMVSHVWSSPTNLMMVLCSGVVAFLVNLSIYWIIGSTSAITYNVVGQLKFSLTMVGGYLLFQDPIQPFQLGGIALTFLGVALYTHSKVQEQKFREAGLPFSTKK